MAPGGVMAFFGAPSMGITLEVQVLPRRHQAGRMVWVVAASRATVSQS